MRDANDLVTVGMRAKTVYVKVGTANLVNWLVDAGKAKAADRVHD